MTKQQEFLNTLKDPVQASIKKACNDLNKKDYGHDLRAISVSYIKKYKAHVVVVLANNPDVLETSKEHFIWYFNKAIPNSTVRVSSRPSREPDIDGQYNIHYFIQVGLIEHPVTMSHPAKTTANRPYFHCPYVPYPDDND